MYIWFMNVGVKHAIIFRSDLNINVLSHGKIRYIGPLTLYRDNKNIKCDLLISFSHPHLTGWRMC